MNQDQAIGALLGLAVGDALGTTLEFTSNPPSDRTLWHTEITGGGAFNVPVGGWTDDTSMALALGYAYKSKHAFNAEQISTNFRAWWLDGEYSWANSCIDIGSATLSALTRLNYLKQGESFYQGSTTPGSSGNGGIMRLAPSVITNAKNLERAVEESVLQSRITHASDECCLYADLLARVLYAGDPFIKDVADYVLPDSTPWSDLPATGYVKDTFQTAMWAARNSDSFEECLILAVNRRGDADTVGAVAGQIAGSMYGYSSIPQRWSEVLVWRDQMIDLAEGLFGVDEKPRSELQDKIHGAMYGLAIGDAMGAPVEFRPRGKFTPVTEFRDGGPFKLKAGQWTDDTSMALCLAASLIECKGMDAKDQMDRYLRWVNDGYMSCVGKGIGIGQTVLRSLVRYHNTKDPYQGSISTKHAGNGCIMRLAPVPIFYHDDAEKAVLNAVDSARTTHASPQALQTTAYFAGLIWGALNQVPKDELLEPYYTPMKDLSFTDLHPHVEKVIAGDYKKYGVEDLSPSGYAPESLEVALWAFYNSERFEEGLLMAVNMGGDADTIGAIYGQLAGAYHGVGGIPESWVQELDGLEYIDDVIAKLTQPMDVAK